MADLAAAGAVASAFRAELPSTRSLVRDATVTFMRAARGLVRAHARVTAPLAELHTALDTDGRVVIPVTIDLVGPDEERLGHVDLRWDLKRVGAHDGRPEGSPVTLMPCRSAHAPTRPPAET